MKLRWHVLFSMLLAGLTFAALTAAGATALLAVGFAALAFVLYWLGYLLVVWDADFEWPWDC